jgi:phosphate uptake regulator
MEEVERKERERDALLEDIVDLELIGDYAYEIATFSGSIKNRPPSQMMSQISDIGAKVQENLATAICSWRSLDGAQALSVRPQEAPIRAQCGSLYEKLAQLAARPGDATTFVDLMLICRHLERILRHAVCVADQAADATPIDHAG